MEADHQQGVLPFRAGGILRGGSAHEAEPGLQRPSSGRGERLASDNGAGDPVDLSQDFFALEGNSQLSTDFKYVHLSTFSLFIQHPFSIFRSETLKNQDNDERRG